MVENIRIKGREVRVKAAGQVYLLHKDVYFEHPFSEGEEVDLETLQARSTLRFAREEGLNYALRGRKSRRQTLDFLQKKYEREICEEALDFLEEQGVIDDRAYARDFIEQHRDSRGNLWLRSKLQQRGIDWEDFPEENIEKVSEILREKYGITGKIEPKTHLKMQNFLLSRGFSYETIRKAIQMLKNVE